MPAPEENHAALVRAPAAAQRKLYGASFAIGDEDAIFLVGQIDNGAVDDDELDRILGSLYQWVEQYFQPALRMGFASHFSRELSEHFSCLDGVCCRSMAVSVSPTFGEVVGRAGPPAGGAVTPDEQRFAGLVRRNPAVVRVLALAEGWDLPGWYLAAGCLFQTVWNVLDGHDPGRGIRDYDLVYFDDSDLSWEAEDEVIRRCAGHDAGVEIEVRNEARVHLWYERKFGVRCAPYRSTEEAIATFPGQACCVGLAHGRGRRHGVRAVRTGRPVRLRAPPQPGAGTAPRVRGQGRPLAAAVAPAGRAPLVREGAPVDARVARSATDRRLPNARREQSVPICRESGPLRGSRSGKLGARGVRCALALRRNVAAMTPRLQVIGGGKMGEALVAGHGGSRVAHRWTSCGWSRSSTPARPSCASGSPAWTWPRRPAPPRATCWR